MVQITIDNVVCAAFLGKHVRLSHVFYNRLTYLGTPASSPQSEGTNCWRQWHAGHNCLSTRSSSSQLGMLVNTGGAA